MLHICRGEYLTNSYFQVRKKLVRTFLNYNSNNEVFEKERSLHKCIIPSTWFDCYSVNVEKTDMDDMIKQLRMEIPWFHNKKMTNAIDSLLYDFQMDSNVKKLKEVYDQFYIELGSEKLIHLAREHRYLSNGESAIFQTSVLGLRSTSRYLNPNYRPSQIERAASIIVTMLRMKFSLEDNTLFPTLHTDQIHPEKQHERYYLYMLKYFTFHHAIRYTQFRRRYRLFFMTKNYIDMYSRSCVPVDKSHSKIIDSTVPPNLHESSSIKHYNNSKHICVISKGIIYKFDALGMEQKTPPWSSSKENVYSFRKIAKTLHSIKMDSEQKSSNLVNNIGMSNDRQSDDGFNYNAIGIGALTALPREEWGRLRSHLKNLSVNNQKNLQDIESAVCVLCLDDVNKPQVKSLNFLMDQSDSTHNVKYYLCENGENRWFDKSTQVVVNNQSNAAILNNLACCDAAPASRLVSEVSLCEKYTPYTYESVQPTYPLEFVALNWTTDNFTNTQIKQASVYSKLIGNSIVESCNRIKLPFFVNYAMNYFVIRYFLVKVLGYSMKKYKKPFRTGYGIYRFCKDGYFDIISLINKPIFIELSKHDGIYNSDVETHKLMNLLGERLYESIKEPYQTSLFDALIYMAQLNNIKIDHFKDDLFQNHILHYDLYIGTLMNRFLDFAAVLPPHKDSVMFTFQADDPTRYHILSYNISSGKARANHVNHDELRKFIETPFK